MMIPRRSKIVLIEKLRLEQFKLEIVGEVIGVTRDMDGYPMSIS